MSQTTDQQQVCDWLIHATDKQIQELFHSVDENTLLQIDKISLDVCDQRGLIIWAN